tara:strand:+ start:6304 stop:7416 length:1113 start_codon:yes stop_codon:yes gene_type:complete
MLILEFNKKDKEVINYASDIFTVSLEFELETDDTEGSSHEEVDDNNNNNNNNNTTNTDSYLDISRENAMKYIKDEYTGDEQEKLYTLIDEILDQLELIGEENDDDFNLTIFDEYLDITNGFEKNLIKVLHADYLTYFTYDNIDFLTDKVKEHMPKFYNKWSDLLKFEIDATLNRGIEFSPLTYMSGIDESIELINDFYDDFDKQDYWYMSERTGIHINIGLKKQTNWNILKGFLMISDEGDQSFTFKDMGWRKKSLYSQTFLPILKKDIESERERVMKHSQFRDIKKLEDFFGKYILDSLEKHGYKNYGFNLTRIKKHNYVEFRYPGGKIPKDILINKVYYFAYIVYLMTEEKYKRREYLKKVYKFINNL